VLYDKEVLADSYSLQMFAFRGAENGTRYSLYWKYIGVLNCKSLFSSNYRETKTYPFL